MFDFLWHLRGSIELDGRIPDAEVLDRVTDMLEKQRKPTIDRGSYSVIFEEPFASKFWSAHSRATVMYDQGRLWIDRQSGQRTLRYDLRSLHALVFCSVGVVPCLLIGLLAGDFVHGATFAAVGFGWVYGMNLLLALFRVPPLIRRTVRIVSYRPST